jgi:predicted transcriptional regulator of viral defense system
MHGRAYFSRGEALSALTSTPVALSAALTRQIRKGRLANPRQGFYIVLRPEDRIAGAPDPVCWIDPLMKHLTIDYRVSLLRAAAFHGASHQAAMVFQVIVPKQLRSVEIGRHRLEFVYQIPAAFVAANQKHYLGSLKSAAGFAKVAGVELTLLDCARYFHRAGGISGLAQIVKDIGGQAKPRNLVGAAVHYENSSVRRLGYLLEYTGHMRQANALQTFVKQAKSTVLLDPAVKPLIEGSDEPHKNASQWLLVINTPVEIDS